MPGFGEFASFGRNRPLSRAQPPAIYFLTQSEIQLRSVGMKKLFFVLLMFPAILCGQVLTVGDVVTLTMRGAPAAQKEIDGDYTVDDEGRIRLPMLDDSIPAAGLTPAGLARRSEAAYRRSGIYANPAIEVVAKKDIQQVGAIITVGGNVKRNGQVPWRKGMTIIQAIDAAGGRDEFGGRNVTLLRRGKQYPLDFHRLDHLNIPVLADDSVRVEAKAVFDRWRGDDASVAPVLKP